MFAPAPVVPAGKNAASVMELCVCVCGGVLSVLLAHAQSGLQHGSTPGGLVILAMAFLSFSFAPSPEKNHKNPGAQTAWAHV